MDKTDVIRLLGVVSLADDRAVRTDEAEQQVQVELWATALRQVPYPFAVEAIGSHYAESVYPVMPKDIAARWRDRVRDTLQRHPGTFEPTAHPHLDPDDHAGYRAALRAERAAIATGQQPPGQVRALVAGVGRRVGPVDEPTPEFRQAKAERYPAREGPDGPPEWAVRCTACGAAAGSACTSLHRGRRLAGVHASRQDAYAASREVSA